jgi:holo-[acyl-carrier protein] synthase
MSARIVTGVDLIELDRIEGAVNRFGMRFLRRIYTQEELDECRGQTASLAGRFAAKEAASKALGTGMRSLDWREIEVLTNRRGKPKVRLRGRAERLAGDLGIADLEISISHSRRDAIAVAVGWSEPA